MTDSTAKAHKLEDAGLNQVERGEQQLQAVKSDLHDEETANGYDENDDDQDRGIIVNARDMVDELIPKQKKKKKKSKRPAGQRGMNKPTGFEDNYADAPLTPDQVAELRELYNPDIPFVERILTAIQRFERTRKLTPERRDVFYKYLAYGGIDVGPNMFQGHIDVENMDKDEVVSAMAQANISATTRGAIIDPKGEPGNPEIEKLGPSQTLLPDHSAKYVVDFLITIKAFLSRRAPVMFASENQDQVSLVTTTLERFMDYLLQHDVCPEYSSEVLSARNLCRKARLEMWNCAEAQRWLPGDFNMACSTLFGGQYGRNYDGETYWGESRPGENVFVGLTPEKATQVVGFAIAGAATEEVYAQYHDIYSNENGDFKVVKTIREHGFEITKIEQPTEDCKELYKQNTSDFRPVGRVYAKFWHNPDAPPEDLTSEERKIRGVTEEPIFPEDTEIVFFLESPTLLQLLDVGQRVEATIHKLNCGVWFFDEFLRLYPTFDVWIENELMMGWKDPKPVNEHANHEVNDGHDES